MQKGSGKNEALDPFIDDEEIDEKAEDDGERAKKRLRDGDDDDEDNLGGQESTGRWTKDEQKLFLAALETYGKEVSKRGI
jgi:hypothetical protein